MLANWLRSLFQLRRDRLGVVHAAPPDATAGVLQRRPQASVGRQARVRGEVRSRGALREFGRAPGNTVIAAGVADEIDRAFELVAIDDDLDAVTRAELAERAAGKRFRRNVANARAG